MLPVGFFFSYGTNHKLSNRQMEILQMIVRGNVTYKQIAAELGTTEQVIKNTLRVMLAKTRTDSRSHLMADVYNTYLTTFMESSGYNKFVTVKPEFESWMARKEQTRQGIMR